MSWNSKVVWTEGLFLQPHHFQQHDRFWEKRIEDRTRPLQAYGWGFAKVEIDRAALSLGRVQITTAHGVFPDGTPFDFPADDPAPLAIEIPQDLRDELILLALPLRRPGTLETDLGSDRQDQSLARFSLGEIEVTDSSASGGGNTALQIGRLRMRLMRASDPTGAYTTLGVVRVVERRADNEVLLSKTYIPPMLDSGADPSLSSYVRDLQGLLHHRGEALAGRLGQLGRAGTDEIANFLLLQTVNRYEPLFAHFAAHSLLHPERLYSTCLQLAGELATFGDKEARTVQFDAYEHDNLEQTFTPVIAHLRQSLSMVVSRAVVQIELQERRYNVRVAIVHELELFKTATFVLAVAAQLSTEVVRSRFPTQVKIGPVERIRELVNLALPGIALHPEPVAPPQLPFHSNFNYFQLERGGPLWQQLERSGGLAIHVAGEYPGLELELWAIRAER
jgi:type VI secretion system protein ImpJ